MSVSERFGAFFAAVNDGADSYPWQCALVEEVAATGQWPDISAPTGSGKSAVVDAHVFLVAEHAAGRLAVRPPRRLVLIAPRRVLVDDQYDRAVRLADRLAGAAERPDSSALVDVARVLPTLCAAETPDQPPAPLAVWRLRGGVLLDNGWRLEPAACQVICATPQMWGSRLLLRGHNASRASRNLEAGLLGHDAVAIIDEAHLHERLVDTARRLRERCPGLLSPQGNPEVDFLVSTQSLEVGVDLDLPAMVTMLASASALAQRAGRLNRSGRYAESTLTVIAPHGSGGQAAPRSGPYSPEELERAAAWLGELDGSISPLAVAELEMALPARPILPQIRMTDLETLAMSSEIGSADPDRELYLQDPETETGRVGVIARRHLDLDPDVVCAALIACPPRAHEIASLPLGNTPDRVAQAVSDHAG